MTDVDRIQIIMQLHDRQLVSSETLLKQLFDPKAVYENIDFAQEMRKLSSERELLKTLGLIKE